MKKLFLLLCVATVLVFTSCEEKLEPASIIDSSLEGIWLTDPTQSDDVNAFKYIVFEGSTLHFYGENEIGNRDYSKHEFTLLNNGRATGMEVFVKGNTVGEDWSFHLFYEFLEGGNSIYVEGLAMTFVGNRVEELPGRASWVTVVPLPDPEYTITSSFDMFWVIDIAKSSNPLELLALCRANDVTYMININVNTGEYIRESGLDNTNFYESLAYGGNCKSLLARSEKAIDIVDCVSTNYLETINLDDFYSIWSICSDETNIWVAGIQSTGQGKQSLAKIGFDGTTTLESVPFVKSPQSMTYGGGYLWLNRGGSIHKVDPSNLTTLVSYQLISDTNFGGSGIEYVDGDLLIVDYSNTLYRLTLE